MKLKQSAMIVFIVAIFLLAASCASAPPPPEPVQEPPQIAEPTELEEEPAPVPEPVIPEPAEDKAAVEKARSDALALGADVLYPQDWSSAETFYKDGIDLYGTENDKSGAALKAALPLYQAMIDKAKLAVQGDLKAAKAAAAAARSAAYDLDAPRYFPSDWEKAETDYSFGGKKASAAEGGELAAYKEAVAAYTKATKAFESITVKTEPALSSAMAKARARADQSRKQAFDLNVSAYNSQEWKAAEALYVKARSLESEASGGKASSYPTAIAEYGKAADAYDSVATKTLPSFATERQAEALKARELALKAGIDSIHPDFLKMADAAALAVIDLYNQGDYYTAYEAWKAARDGYHALATGSDAYKVKEKIDSRNFGAYDSGNYALGSGKLQESIAAYEAGDVIKAKSAAEEASLRLGIAYLKGQEYYAVDRGKSADTERKAATELKANVAVKDEYEKASSLLAEADAAFQAELFDEASELYKESEKMFAVAKQTAAEKRAAALKALEEARARMTDSERTAREADATVTGGAK